MPKYYKTTKWKQLLKHLEKNDPQLTTLDLSKNDLGDSGVIELCLALKNNTSLTNLNISYNGIGDSAIENLCEIFKNNLTISILNLSINQINLRGAKALCQILEKNTSLRVLNLWGNDIGMSQGMQAFNMALQKNTTIYKLTLGTSNFFPDKNLVKEIESKLSKNAELYKATNKEIQQIIRKAEYGDAESQFQLGTKYELGNDSFEKNIEKAKEWFLRAAKQDHLEAQACLGEKLIGKRENMFQKYHEAGLAWLNKAANKGNTHAQSFLGAIYLGIFRENQRGIIYGENPHFDQLPFNPTRGLEWFKLAAEKGNVTAQYNLGTIYKRGYKGIKVDLQAAATWYRKAAEQGDAKSQFELGALLDDGIEEHSKEAFEWYSKAAEQCTEENIPEQRTRINLLCRLGQIYETGTGTMKDIVQALFWYDMCVSTFHSPRTEAAEKAFKQYSPELVALALKVNSGDASAQFRLAESFMTGKLGLSRNVNEAIKWYQKSAEQNYILAQNALGLIYENGVSNEISKDIPKALYWYELSAANGHEEAKKAVERLQNQTSEKAKLLNELDQIITCAEKMEGTLDELGKKVRDNPEHFAKFKENKLFKANSEVGERLEAKVSTLTNDPTSIQEKLPVKSSVTLASAVSEPCTASKMQIPIQEWNSTLQRLRENDPSLTSLYLGYKKIADQDVQELGEALKGNRTVTSLNLGENVIGDKGTAILSDALKTNRTLQSLDLSFNQINDEGAQVLSEVIKINATLKSLQLYGNQIGDKGIQKLSEALKNNSTLTSFNFYHNPITDQGIQTISEVLKTNRALKSLTLNVNQIGDKGGQALKEALKINQTLTSLVLQINAKGIQILNEILQANCTFSTLILGGNQLGDQEMQVLSAGLKNNRTLTSLDIGNNEIGDKGIQALCEVLKVNSTLRALNFGVNKINDEGAQAFSQVLEINCHLTLLNFSSNQIGDKGAIALAEALRNNRTLASIDLSLNRISAEGARALSEMFKVNRILTSLHLSSNQIGDEGTQGFIKILKDNRTLSTLYLGKNKISNRIAQELLETLKTNRALTTIGLWGNQIIVEVEKKITSLCSSNMQLRNQLYEAINANQLTMVQSLIKQGVSFFYAHGAEMDSVLHRAVVCQNASLVEWLLQEMQSRKIPLTFRNKEGKTAEDLTKNKPTLLALFPKMELLQPASLPYNLDSKGDVNDGKSWHFDPEIKPSSIPKDVPYVLIDGSHKDKEKISQLYLRDPVPGKSIKSVQIIYNSTLNKSFELRMRSLEQRYGESAFAPQWHTENNPEWRKEVDQLCQTLTAPYADTNYPHVKIALAWHGTDPAALPSIFKTGFANLAKTDTGFFGKGYYFTFNVEYAQRVYSKGALLLSCVSFYSAYPTIDGDKPKLQEKGNYKNYDAHFVPVIPPSGKFSYDTTVYYPCKPNQKHQYVEVVVFDSGQCFPQYVVELQDNLLKAPSNPLKQEGKKEKTKPEQKIKNTPTYYSEKNPYLIFDKKESSAEAFSASSSHSNLEKGFK